MSFAAAAAGITANGGVPLINLGLNTIVGLSTNPALVTQIYNYFSMIQLMLIAVSASRLDAKFVGILLPLWAGFEMWAGWLQYPNQANGFALIVVMMILGIGIYITETRHERFGLAGPGNTMIKFFTFLVVLQATVCFVNSAAIFPSDVQPITPSNPAYASINLQNEMGNINGSGGLFGQIVDIVTITAQMAASALLLVLKVIIGIAAFSVVLSQIFPWIVQAGTVGIAFLAILQFAIWISYLIFVFSIFHPVGPDPGW